MAKSGRVINTYITYIFWGKYIYPCSDHNRSKPDIGLDVSDVSVGREATESNPGTPVNQVGDILDPFRITSVI